MTAFNSVKGWRQLRGIPGGDETLESIAAKHGITKVQVLIRWAIDHGMSAIPGCTSKQHLKEALEVRHLSPLDDADLERIGGTVVLAPQTGAKDEL